MFVQPVETPRYAILMGLHGSPHLAADETATDKQLIPLTHSLILFINSQLLSILLSFLSPLIQ